MVALVNATARRLRRRAIAERRSSASRRPVPAAGDPAPDDPHPDRRRRRRPRRDRHPRAARHDARRRLRRRRSARSRSCSLFATPALCQSRVCGPVVDIAEQVKARARRRRRLHPHGDLRGQRRQQGPPRAGPGLRPADRAVAVRDRRRRQGRHPRSRAPSASTSSTPPSTGSPDSCPTGGYSLTPRGRGAPAWRSP